MLGPRRDFWTSIAIWAWILGHLAGYYYLGAVMALPVLAGWFVAMILWVIDQRLVVGTNPESGRSSWGQAAIYTLFLHWVAVALLVKEIVRKKRDRSGGRGDTTGRG